MRFFLDTESTENPPKRLKLSLSRGKKSSITIALKESTNQLANPNRFAKPVTFLNARKWQIKE